MAYSFLFIQFYFSTVRAPEQSNEKNAPDSDNASTGKWQCN